MNFKIILLALASLLSACAHKGRCPKAIKGVKNLKITLASEVSWEQLNPARGEKSPQAGTLWGDRKAKVKTGFLVKFVDGFSSPPHIHNVTYRGVVINGMIHNDDPQAAEMWMPAGSFWTQPKGEVHITAAKGQKNVAYIEIEDGPYLVMPSNEAFDSGERPVNVDASNIVWLGAAECSWLGYQKCSKPGQNPKAAFLWGSPQENQLNGTMIKLPAGFKGKLVSHDDSFRAITIKGQLTYRLSRSETKTLDPGSFFSSSGHSAHYIEASANKECVIYIRTKGKYHLLSKK